MDTKKRDAEIYAELGLDPNKLPKNTTITSIGKLSYPDETPRELHVTIACKAEASILVDLKNESPYYFSGERSVENLDVFEVMFQRNYPHGLTQTVSDVPTRVPTQNKVSKKMQ
jgi:hypothetical protein